MATEQIEALQRERDVYMAHELRIIQGKGPIILTLFCAQNVIHLLIQIVDNTFPFFTMTQNVMK